MTDSLKHDDAQIQSIRHFANDNSVASLVHKLTPHIDTTRHPIITFITALPGEGMTTLANEFATSLAHDFHKKVLIIHTQATNVSQNVDAIIDAMATQQDPMNAIIQMSHDIHRTLWLSNPVHRSLSGKMLLDNTFWQSLRQSFDFVIIDAPSLKSSSDGIAFAQRADTTVLVTSAETTRRHVLENLRDTLKMQGRQSQELSSISANFIYLRRYTRSCKNDSFG